MFRVGLTGNIASGKSAVARRWAALGAPIVDADVLARRAVAPGTPALARIRESFGDRVLLSDGQLDREALRAIVFEDPAARGRLEEIVHPEVERLRREEEARLGAAGAAVVVHDIPLLFEVGMEDRFDLIVLVDAPAGVRLERLTRIRGLDEAEASRMIAAQMDVEAKRGGADIVIENDGTLARLAARAEETWAEIRRRAAASA
jgi:dephospho-CoA kinase